MNLDTCGELRNVLKSTVVNIITWLRYPPVRKCINLLADAACLDFFNPKPIQILSL